MHSSSFLALALAICGGVVAVAVPSNTAPIPPTPVAEFAAAATPDCTSIEEYCKCKDDDFQCETNLNCEWCRDHNAWGDENPTSSSKA
ncbi:hypothetical protein F4813DRAFT_400580 [Daldinia decipiens]|uniref:uncharacterized protein n=1 Tax=Daldinia decipiens TaxID=326647 RepID=UPI0020C523FC|nr:uncharacterized protein F4813DRAFT_400580 [Daldinia decipiens]KAI1652793.1 hypothetical protein F4813DRAFT_400580 [Daldinia decipiens]